MVGTSVVQMPVLLCRDVLFIPSQNLSFRIAPFHPGVLWRRVGLAHRYILLRVPSFKKGFLTLAELVHRAEPPSERLHFRDFIVPS